MPFIAPLVILYEYWPAEGEAPGSWALAEIAEDDCCKAPHCACNKDCADLSVQMFLSDTTDRNNRKPGEYAKLTTNWQHRVSNIASEDCIEGHAFCCEHGLHCCLCHSCSCKVCSTGCCYTGDGQLEQTDYQAMPAETPANEPLEVGNKKI